jgi:hypothetical protein
LEGKESYVLRKYKIEPTYSVVRRNYEESAIGLKQMNET